MVTEYGIYEQGAMFTREDFDPYKTIKYLFDSYEIEMPEKLAEDIKNDKVSDEEFDYICKELDVTPDKRTLQSIVIDALNPALLSDIAVDDSSETCFQNDSIYVSYFTDIVGEFTFDNEDRNCDSIEDECIMVCFHIPCVWNIRDSDIPCDKRIAAFQLQQATKAFLKDDINWEERLGKLYASGYNS